MIKIHSASLLQDLSFRQKRFHNAYEDLLLSGGGGLLASCDVGTLDLLGASGLGEVQLAKVNFKIGGRLATGQTGI